MWNILVVRFNFQVFLYTTELYKDLSVDEEIKNAFIILKVGQRFIFKFGIKIPLEEMNFTVMVSVMCQQLQACMT